MPIDPNDDEREMNDNPNIVPQDRERDDVELDDDLDDLDLDDEAGATRVRAPRAEEDHAKGDPSDDAIDYDDIEDDE